MTIVKILDDVTRWAQENICSKVQLKVPPKNTEPNDNHYEYNTANPVAFTMYVPTEDKLPEGIPSAFPSLCVRFMEGEDDLAKKTGTMGIQFLLSVWNPGTYGQDVLEPNPDDALSWQAQGDKNVKFARNGDGWRDVWNFTDVAVRAIESTTRISEFEIDHSVPIKFGPLTEQEAIPDFYPFWFTWVSFQLTYPLLRNTEDLQDFL